MNFDQCDVVEKALAAEMGKRARYLWFCVNRLATNSKSSKYQIYSTAAFFMPPAFYILSKGVPPGSDKRIWHFFADIHPQNI